ncbi:hypothetical protein EBU94_02715 [bacterium]|nr:hypothetical protein [bacterium]
MEKFSKYFNFLMESFMIQELLPNTNLFDLKNSKKIKVYRSCARPDKTTYNSGFHAGTLQQALIRADYFLNDEETHDEYYLYELEIVLGRIYPQLEIDKGENHGSDYYAKIFKDYDTVIYKNTGEGNIENENLSIVVLNPQNVVSSKKVKTLTKEYLSSIQDRLYS